MRKTRVHIQELRDDFADKVDLTPCYYCGLVADTIDHVIPRKVLKLLTDLNDLTVLKLMKADNRVLTVNACRECNVILSSSYQDTLYERKAELKRRLRKRYNKILNTP